MIPSFLKLSLSDLLPINSIKELAKSFALLVLNNLPYFPSSSTLLNAGKSEAKTGVPVAIASNNTIPNDSPPKFGAT